MTTSKSIAEIIQERKDSLASTVKTIMPNGAIPTKGSASRSLTTYSVLSIYPQGGPRPGRTAIKGSGAGRISWVLPAPTEIVDLASVGYDAVPMGFAGRFMTGLVGAGADKAMQYRDQIANALQGNGNLRDIMQNVMKDAGKALDMSGQELKTFGSFLKNASEGELIGLLDATGIGSGIAGYLSAAKRVAANPNTELLFKAPNIRVFQFGWNLIPFNAKDAANISEFTSQVRAFTYPEINSQDAPQNILQAYYRFPAEFDIRIYAQGESKRKVLVAMATSVCTDFQIGYTPNGVYGPHPDGEPTATTIALTLQETYLLDRQAIDNMYKDSV